MKYLNGYCYVEVNDKRFMIRPNEKNILRKQNRPKPLRTQCQVQNETQIRKNHKIFENNGRLEVRSYLK